MVYCLRDLGMQHFDVCLHTDEVFILEEEDYKLIMNMNFRVDRRLQQQQQ